MCFSATASFVAGAALCTASIFSIRKIKTRNQFPFAVIPLLFGLQQLSEGVLWLSLNGTIGEEWLWPSALTFLVFAQVIWPFWVPLAFLSPEPIKKRKFFLSGILTLGIILSLYHIYCLIHFPIAVSDSAHHIDYLREFPDRPAKIISGIYVIVTLLPPFLSSIKGMKFLGSAVLLSFLVTLFIYREHLISVWCLFAAIVSVIVIFVMYRWNRVVLKTE